ncbi:unnamed protein product [Gongylonema pulchrum]|uniref:DNA replication ATP-dependent helicase/nuclease n=1 Tax=Gongylonema pulchrum TaxID=637853 RepID=A0A183EHF7_9BILA|nr:unnamed protein product [Gongylonema pulchrum]
MRKEDISIISEVVKQLNGDQARAVVKCLMAKDFAVIEGFPGSGKTSALVALVRCSLLLGRTVLVTSHTHSAIDNLLVKLVKPVVACTCLGVARNTLFSYRHFSMTLVDEASLVLEPTTIPAVAAADVFVLVGDHRQLTPLVRSQQLRPIAELSSTLFYDSKLRCANNGVAEACLPVVAQNPAVAADHFFSRHLSICELCVSNALTDTIVFVDTKSRENSSFCATFGDSGVEVYNVGEAEFVVNLCELFIKVTSLTLC